MSPEGSEKPRRRGRKRSKPLRVLWATIDRSHMAAQLFDPLRVATERRPDTEVVTVMRGALDAWQIRQRTMDPVLDLDQVNGCEVVFCDAPWAYTTEAWDQVRVPVACLFEDMHGPLVAGYLDYWLRERRLAHVFVRYRRASMAMWPQLSGRHVVWLPHSVDTEVFRDLVPWDERDVNVLVTGRMSPVYRFRQHVAAALAAVPGYERVTRPENVVGAWPTGHAYALLLASAKMALQGLVWGYVTAKSVEAPACGTVLLTNWEPEMADMGFRAGSNCIVVDERTALRSVTTWLEDDASLREVARRGADLVASRHTAERRAEKLVQELRKL